MVHQYSAPSRRNFLKMSSLGMAFTGLSARGLAAATPTPRDLVLQPLIAPPSGSHLPIQIDSNENPYGPSEKALAAIKNSFSMAGRYADNTGELYHALASHHKVNSGMIAVGYGSSEILKMAAEAFLGPGKNVVVAHPSYEAVPRYAQLYRAQTVRVPLDSKYRHDLKKMRAAVTEQTGLVYLCNPNNPTATIVPASEVREFLASMPTNVPVLIDEAYHHYVDDSSYSSSIAFAKEGKAVVATRTFSKIYGMAGLRLGYAVGREDLIGRLAAYQVWLNTNVLSVAAGLASLDDEQFVARNQQLNAKTRRYVEEQVASLGLHWIPSQANFMMIDLKRAVHSVLGALRSRNVLAGRPFPLLTTHLRVTIGTAEEMRRFVEELKVVLA